MRGHLRAAGLLLAASLGVAPALPAQALAVTYKCGYLALMDPTDVQGQQTWIELTYSYFVGTPDVTSWEITCWLASQNGEIANTRHTCLGTLPVGACINPVIFQINASSTVFDCGHVSWTDLSAEDEAVLDEYSTELDLLDHLHRDLFSTGGVTTMGGPNQITATVVLAVNNLIATLTVPDVDELLPGTPTSHTVEINDPDPSTPQNECTMPVASAPGVGHYR